MRMYAQYNSDGTLFAIGIGGIAGVEITKEEYETLLSEIREKGSLVYKLYNGEITIEDVPTKWREEIQERVDERIEADGQAEEQEISSEEFYDMLEGVL